MKLVYAGAIATIIVLSVGIAMVLPIFFTDARTNDYLQVVLVFDVGKDSTEIWCQNLSSLLTKENVRATVFFSGEFAIAHPKSVSQFNEGVDIGSKTYSHANLTAISDYSLQLREVVDGKTAVDIAGDLDSKLFRTPYGATDDNIYSLLNRADILADFSYPDHYNQYVNGQFIRIEIPVYELSNTQTSYLLGLTKQDDADKIIINIDDSTPIEKIADLILSMKSAKFRFINASDLLRIDLTNRK